MKVLLVDDDTNIRMVAVMGLEDELDWEIQEASSGQEAIQLASTQKPDLILLDMMMPGMDGISTFGKLRELDTAKDTPIIFMTAKVQPEEIESYKILGAQGVIIKPFDPITLAQEIQDILAQKFDA
ncbi:MAG TPA: response regulator [Candidatus Obscuribacter sp.]|nr:response regulator [Candidatus Obscuribacter sp.]HMY54192.1 response regulator [Candidatus Obscuribacter sp.]HND08231.1 response regulator [Candidatus Obscuribacter sp.]HND68488.1 response regulator [Candidatus Obscuribacter sp.]